MSGRKTMINDLTEGSVAKQLLIFAYPFAISNVLQLVYNLVDMIVIGRFVGSTGLSAVAVGGDVLNLMTHICLGFTTAGQIMIAQYVGRGERENVSRTIGTMFTSVLIGAVALAAVCALFADRILDVMNTPEAARAQAKSYILVCFAGMIFIYGYNTVSAILRGMGDSKRPLMFIAAAATMNLILDLLFVAKLNMDAFGAALATVIGQAASFIGSLIYLYKRRSAFGFDFKLSSFRITGRIFGPMLKLGLPLALQHISISISIMVVAALANSFGVVASAVTGVGAKLTTSISAFSNALGAASASMIGQNVGAGRLDRVQRILRTAYAVTVSVFIVIGSVFLLFPKGVFGLFSSAPEILAWAPIYMKPCVLCMFSFSLIGPALSLVNGVGDAGFSLFVGLLDGVVARIGLAVLFGITLGYGVKGFWYGNAIAAYFTAIPAIIYHLSGHWKKRKLIIGDRQ